MSQLPTNWVQFSANMLPNSMPPSMLLHGNQFPNYGMANASGSTASSFPDVPNPSSRNGIKRPRRDSDENKENTHPKRTKEEYETSSEDDDQEDEDGEEHEDEEEADSGASDAKTPPTRFSNASNQASLGNPLAHSTPYAAPTSLYNGWGAQFPTQSYSNLFPSGGNLNDTYAYSSPFFNAQQMAYNFTYPGSLRQNWNMAPPMVNSTITNGLNPAGFPFGGNRSGDSGILAETTNSSDESSGSLKSDVVATYDQQGGSENDSNSITFCMVPGRLTLLSNTKKYKVTLAEIHRRISPPECLNASLLGGILRKAKNKDGGKALRDELKRVNINLPSGRRKSVQTTVFTALCEEEAFTMARDFDEVSKKNFPTREVASAFIQAIGSSEEARQKRTLLINASAALKELVEIIKKSRIESPDTSIQNGPIPTLIDTPTKQLREFSLLTHGFGCAAHQTSWEVLYTTIHEALLILENCYPQFFGNMAIPPYAATQNFGLPMSMMRY